MRRFNCDFEGYEILDVKIGESALPVLKEMFEFWYSPEELAAHGGDYFLWFASALTLFIVRNDRTPREGDEGWAVPLESYGIEIISWESFSLTHDDINVVEEGAQ